MSKLVEDGAYTMDTGWACGLVVFEDGVVVECAPIFKKRFLGGRISARTSYEFKRLPDLIGEDEE